MDLVARVPRLTSAGETLSGHSLAMVPGGKGANQAVACARLGAPTRMVGCVGDDVFGTALSDSLRRYGVDTTGVTVSPGVSGIAIINVDDRAENNIVIIAGTNGQVGAPDLRQLEIALQGAEALLLQLEVPVDAVLAAARLARAQGVRVILDPAPARPPPDDLHTLADVLTPNESEAAALVGFAVTDVRAAERAAQMLRDRGARQVILKWVGRVLTRTTADRAGSSPLFPCHTSGYTEPDDLSRVSQPPRPTEPGDLGEVSHLKWVSACSILEHFSPRRL